MSDKGSKKAAIEWQVNPSEHNPKKDKDFYAVLWIFAVTFFVVTLLFTNSFITALVFIAGAFALHSHHKNKPEIQEGYKVALTSRGIKVKNILYPFSSVNRFNIIEEEGEFFLVVDLASMLIPDLVLPIAEEDADEIDFFLMQFVSKDDDMHMPWTHLIAESLGL